MSLFKDRSDKGRRRSKLYAVLWLLTSLTISGCEGVPQTKVSLSEPNETPHDERVIGFWRLNFLFEPTDEDKEKYGEEIEGFIGALHLQVWPREDGTLSVLGMESSATGAYVSWVQADAHASEIDGEVYYNLKLRAVDRGFYSINEHEELAGFRFDQDIEQRYIILRANISDEDKLFLHFMNPHVLRDLIEQDQISGRIADCGTGCDFAVVDASRDELLELISEFGAERIFMEYALGPFHRAEVDTKRPIILEFRENWANWRSENIDQLEDIED